MDIGFYRTYFEIEKRHWLMRGRRGIVRDAIEAIAGGHPASRIKILDYGSGSGFLVGELQSAGFDASGIDMSQEAIDYGTSQGIRNLSVDHGTQGFPENTYDVALAMDVLEHIADPAPVIRGIEKSLKPDGYFIITVPAYMFLWGVQDEVAHHYRRYTKSSLLKVIRDSSSLEIIRVSYFNTFLFAPIALVRLGTRLLRLKNRESDFDLNNPFINKVLFSVFNFERKLLKRINYPFGVSVLAVLKRRMK
jgi:2-polyprenyl-3-methyl-5-hydroxy-6-metoxy-1,4-benzoquinol methylase